VLYNELRGRNITVNAVAPGPVATELFLTGKDEAQIEHLRKLPPLERLGQPEDIANLVSFIHGGTIGYGGTFSGGLAPLFISPSNTPGSPTSGTHKNGSSV
jgi:Enoyl-(Acyl carrier protein) reductase